MAKKGKKAKAAKLPKTIAGVKLSKKVRHAGASLTGMLNSDAGRAALGAALVAAGEALARQLPAAQARPKGGTALGTVAGVAATLVGEAARQVLSPGAADDGGADAPPPRAPAKPSAAGFVPPADDDESPRKRRAKH